MVVFDQDAARQVQPVIGSPAAKDCVLFERAQTGHGLARVEDARIRPLDGIDIRSRNGRDAAHVLQQVKNHALAAKEHPRVVPNHRQNLARANAHAVENLRMADDLEPIVRLRAWIQPPENLQELRNAP